MVSVFELYRKLLGDNALFGTGIVHFLWALRYAR